MAAISGVYTIARVAEILGRNEDWLDDIAIDGPGRLWLRDSFVFRAHFPDRSGGETDLHL
jgi:hypothetical protein